MTVSGIGAMPDQPNFVQSNTKVQQEEISIFNYEDVNHNGEIDTADVRYDNNIINWLKSKGLLGKKWVDVEKAEIKAQYPHYTKEDVNARYEIEHMNYRSAELMEVLHSGTLPSQALAEYKQNLSNIKNSTRIEYTPPDEKNELDGFTVESRYDKHNRIISRVITYDNPENGNNTSTYIYNDDGSYTCISIENNGYNQIVSQYDTHGKLISERFNNDESEDMTGIKFDGDYR